MTDSVDLYRPPQAALEQRLGAPLDGLPSHSTWLVFFLTLITMGIYMVWWLYSRSIAINRALGATVITAGYTVVVPAMYAVHLLVSTIDRALALGLYEQYGTVSTMLRVFQLSVSIASILWTFEMRKHLLVLIGERVRIGPVLTFLFGGFYLNYKIREGSSYLEYKVREAKGVAQPVQAQMSDPAHTAVLPA